ncbi:nucleoside hydrolase [Treponema sp. HNW]|uniref:nucleoside hydrolase n=1 Tax=Treponema sp. HNW TaxID=3116654 RepID=UPI003D0A8518
MAVFPVLLDSDMALGSKHADVDDAIAILLALSESGLSVKGISPSAGNVSGEKSGANIDRLLRIIGCTVEHASFPSHTWDPSLWIYNRWAKQESSEIKTCFGNQMRSVDFIAAKLLESPEPLYIITIGPLTNIATLLSIYPESVQKIKAVYMMGGSWYTPGVDGGEAEFNILCDPEAAQFVFSFPLKIVMCGLDITKKRKIFPRDLSPWIDSGRPFLKYLAEVCISFMNFRALRDGYHPPYAFFHDVMPILALLYPEWFTFVPCKIDIDTDGEFVRGKTIIDVKLRGRQSFPHLVAKDVDEEKVLYYVVSKIMSAYGDIVI